MMQTSNPAASSDPTAGITSAENWNAYVEDFAKSAHQTVDWIAAFLREVRRYPVLPSLQPGELIDALPAHAPQQGEPFSAMLRDFEQQVMPAVTHWNHPGFFAYFGTTGSTPAILADMLSAALNTNGLHWKTSPAVAELEHVTLSWLREWIGLPPEFFGIIYDTASTTSMHALVAAREFKYPEARVEGSTPNMVVYTSEQSHSSIEKGAIAIGIGQNNVRKVAVDAEFRLAGLGSALFEAMCGCFRKVKVTKVRTMLARDAHVIMSFFRRQGMMAGPFTELETELEG